MLSRLMYVFFLFYALEISQEENAEYFDILKSEMSKCSQESLEKKREESIFNFGPQFNLITDAWSNDTEALARICPTKEITKEASAYAIHPTLIDACFQTIILLNELAGKLVPRKIARVTILQKPTCTEYFYAHTTTVESEKITTYSITLMDRYATRLVIVEKVLLADLSADDAVAIFENASFSFGWEVLTSETPTSSQDNVWLILRDQSKFADRFSQFLPAKESVYFVDIQGTSEKTRDEISEELDGILDKIEGEEKLLVMNFLPVNGSNFNTETQNFDDTHANAFESCLLISQEIIKRQAFLRNVQLVFVTSGVITILQTDRDPNIDNSDAFPYGLLLYLDSEELFLKKLQQ